MVESCYTKNVINHKTSAARIPQQNSITEHRNWSLKEAVHTMLNETNLPKKLWAEAISTK